MGYRKLSEIQYGALNTLICPFIRIFLFHLGDPLTLG